MKRKILEEFQYAFDGVTPNRMRVGKWRDIRDEDVARFEAEGKIEPLSPASPAPVRKPARARRK